MKVSVNCSVTYSFETDVPEMMVTDLPYYVDACDPVYSDICKMLAAKGLNHDGEIVSIVGAETDEVYYAL